MELERHIKINKNTPKDVATQSSNITIPPKKKPIDENSPIIRRLREDEEKAKRQKLSDDELIEREFRDEANAIRARAMREDLLRDEMTEGDIEEYIQSTKIPLTRNLADLDENNIMPPEHSFVDLLHTTTHIPHSFVANENFDENITRTPLPKNEPDSTQAHSKNASMANHKISKVDKIDLSDLLPDAPNTTQKRDSKGDIKHKDSIDSISATNIANSTNTRNIEQDTLYIDFSKESPSTRQIQESSRDSYNSNNAIAHTRNASQESDESPIKITTNPANTANANEAPYYAEDLPPVFMQEQKDLSMDLSPNITHNAHDSYNNTAHIIENIAHQKNSDEIVGIYTPQEQDFESGEHSVRIVDKIDSYDIEFPKVRALYNDILGDNSIIDATDDIDTLNDIHSSLERAQKRLTEKLKVAKMRQNLGDIKSLTPIDSDVMGGNYDTENSAIPSQNQAHIPNQTTSNYESTMLTRNEIIAKENELAKQAQDSMQDSAQNMQDSNVSQDEYNENFFDLPQHKIQSEISHTNYGAIPNNAIPRSIPNTTIVPNPSDSSGFQLPPLELLNPPFAQKIDIDDSEIDIKVQNLFNKLRVFKIEGDIVRTYSGPVVTTFEFRPAPNVKVSRIQNLQDDLSMALKATSIRIQAPIPGKDVVGIEIPNNKIQTIYLREVFESDEFRSANAHLPIALGKDVIGNPVIEDLAKLPHLLIAGTTGSGKSVGINAMILSLLYKHTPKDLRFIMIDPKFLEFGLYKDIPHLLTPIITDPKKAIIALSKAVEEMNRRYELMDKAKVKTIVGFNELAAQNGEEKLPYILIIIDEFADLMIMGGREAEQFLISLAGKARASGIHLIIATQRPTVNVVTGLIKGNLPSKISYRVGSKIDSKVILDETGAEALLGRGDMLFSKTNNIVRLHAPYNDEREIERVVDFLKSQQEVEYDEFFSLEAKEPSAAPQPTQISSEGDYKERAKEIITQSGKTSISYLQRGLGVGFNKAASIIESLEKDGFLSPPNSKGVREILGD